MLTVDYYAQLSGISHWNSVFKILFALAALILTVASDSILFALVVLISMSLISLLAGKAPPRIYFRLLLIPMLFASVSCAVLLFHIAEHSEGLVSIPFFSYYVCIGQADLYRSLLLFFKAFGAVSCLYMLILSTPSHQVIAALRKCRLPQVITELMSLIYRFIFVLTEAQRQMLTSSLSRMGNCTFAASRRTFIGIVTNLFVIAMKKASAVFDAMEARCYDGTLAFLEPEKPFTKKQAAIGLCYFSGLILLFFLIKTNAVKPFVI